MSNLTPPGRASAGALSVAIFYPTVLTLVYFVLLRDQSSAWQLGVGGLGKVLQFGFPLFYVYLVLKQRPRFPRRPLAGMGPSLLFGGLILIAMLALYHLVLEPAGLFDDPGEEIRKKIVGMGLSSSTAYLLFGAFYAAVHSLLEEYYWRWFVFRQLRERMSLGWSVLLSSLGFASHHVILLVVYFGARSIFTYLFIAGVAIGGAVWALIYNRYRSLIAPWLSHALVDLAIFLIGYELARDLLS